METYAHEVLHLALREALLERALLAAVEAAEAGLRLAWVRESKSTGRVDDTLAHCVGMECFRIVNQRA